MTDSPFAILLSPANSPDARMLMEMLSLELTAIYGRGDDCCGGFDAQIVTPPRGGFLIGRVGTVPVACGAFRPFSDDTAEIKRMFVVPEFRGRGYSKQILADLERLASDAGYRRLCLETGTMQPKAIALYERSGFHRVPNYGVYADFERSICFARAISVDDREPTSL